MTLSRAMTPIVAAAVVAGALTAAAADLRLVDAVKKGDATAVRSLIRQRVPVGEAEADGSTALHWAVRADRSDLVQALVRAGAPVDATNRYGVTPLMLAAVNGSAPVAGLLLEAGANPNATGPDGDTVLMIAARTGRPDLVRLLLARSVDVNARERWQGETALMWAAGEDHPEVVALLAVRGADLNVRSIVPELPKVKVDAATMVFTALPRGGMTALMFAARQGAAGGARALVDAGARLNETDPDGMTALNIAIINAHYDVAALLIEKGVDPNVADAAGMTPLYAVIDMQHQEPLVNRPLPRPSGRLRPVDVVKLLLAHGANPNTALKTPLLMRQHNGGDPSLGDGATPLMRAAKVSNVTFLGLLLDAGADPNRRLRNQTTALMIAAARSGRNAGPEQTTIDAARLLIAKGADVNAANDNGETALHIAVGRGDGLVRFLAENGARLDARDKSERTPLDVALGVPAAGGGGRGRGGRGGAPTPGPVRESTAALLRELMNPKP
jgi:ankyrin repeat protein